MDTFTDRGHFRASAGLGRSPKYGVVCTWNSRTVCPFLVPPPGYNNSLHKLLLYRDRKLEAVYHFALRPAAGCRIDARGVHAAVAQQVRKSGDVVGFVIVRYREQMPEIMEEYLLRRNICLFREKSLLANSA